METHSQRPNPDVVLGRAASDFKRLQIEREKDSPPWAEKLGKHSITYLVTATEAIFSIVPSVTHAEVARLPLAVYPPLRVEMDDSRTNLFYDRIPFDEGLIDPLSHARALYEELNWSA